MIIVQLVPKYQWGYFSPNMCESFGMPIASSLPDMCCTISIVALYALSWFIWCIIKGHIKTVFSIMDPHHKDETLLRPSHLYYGNSPTGETAYLYWNNPHHIIYRAIVLPKNPQ